MRKKKILFLINTLACGGAEKVLINLLNQLDKTKYEIDLLVVEDGVNADNLDKNIQYRCILKRKKGFLHGIKKWLIYHLPYRLFSKFFIKGEYDCEIAFLEGFPTRIIACRRTKARKIVVVHCSLTYNIVSGLYNTPRDVHKDYDKLDQVVFVSESAKQIFEKNFGALNNAKVLHNVMDINEIKDLSMQECSIRYQTTGTKLISIGRLEKVKGFDRLFNIVSHLEKKYAFELWLLGDGSQCEFLEQQLKEKDIHSIKLLGYQKNPYPFLKQADVYVCSSYAEGYSTVIKESLFCGVPVITTNCGGAHEILTEGENGYIVDNSEEALERGLEKLLLDKTLLSVVKNGALDYINKYNTRQEIEEYEKLLDGENYV